MRTRQRPQTEEFVRAALMPHQCPRRRFSDRMLMFRLKALKPERYGKPG
jgi:hypothetical protein